MKACHTENKGIGSAFILMAYVVEIQRKGIGCECNLKGYEVKWKYVTRRKRMRILLAQSMWSTAFADGMWKYLECKMIENSYV